MEAGIVGAVRDSQPLSVDVSELLEQPGAVMRVKRTSSIEGARVPLAWVKEGSSLAVDLELSALVDGIHVTGTIAGTFGSKCRRCLKETETQAEVEVAEIAGYPGDVREDLYDLDGERLDLEPIVLDTVVGDMPFNPLCREDCTGLCSTCGADRNEEDCGHDHDQVDARWAPLGSLKQRMED